jgi:Uma2 family endonuclease
MATFIKIQANCNQQRNRHTAEYLMFAIVSLDRLELPPGSVVKLPCTWEEYDSLEQRRGDRSIPRMKYRNGEILLMVPLPEHGKDAHVMSDIVKTLLDRQQIDYDAFTPVTMKLPERGGIEPDYCFYIENWQAVQGKRRIDWEIDPPPDLVIEVDVTSYSDVNDYLIYKIPEVWLLRGSRLQIYRLVAEEYVLARESQYFSGMNLPTIAADCLRIAYEQNTSAAIRHLRSR